jgi:hypothetical protein
VGGLVQCTYNSGTTHFGIFAEPGHIATIGLLSCDKCLCHLHTKSEEEKRETPLKPVKRRMQEEQKEQKAIGGACEPGTLQARGIRRS